MHFQFLVEDLSGKKMLEHLVPRILGNGHTHDIKSYKGCGRIPPGMKPKTGASKRILLDQLPKLLSGFGKTFEGYGDYPAAVIVVCDLDDRPLPEFLRQLQALLDNCNPQPNTKFCVAVEEGEAWLLGDIKAILSAYPPAKKDVLRGYKNDSICGTWEVLAEALYPGGLQKLKVKGWVEAGKMKFEWASKISPFMEIDHNKSPSFNHFLTSIRSLTAET